MKIVYMATAAIAGPVLQALHASPEHEVVGVVSQPDRPQGRKRKIQPSPVKQLAMALGLPVITPESIGSADGLAQLRAWDPEIQVVFAYGQYIPSSVTELPPRGSINLHPSMLPAYRGAAPIQWAIADGLSRTGISVIYVTRKMDAGDIVVQREVPIDPADTSASLSEVMAAEGASLILEALRLIADPDFRPTPQDESQVSEARKLTVADRALDFQRPADELRNWIRACQPWPGTTLAYAGGSLKLLAVEVVPEAGPVGELRVVDGWPLVGCGDGQSLKLRTVQPPGKTPMAGDAFWRGVVTD